MRSPSAGYRGATLAEAIVGLAVFAMLTLAVVGMLIQTAHLDTKDTGLTETTFLADGLMEKTVSDARDYSIFRDLTSTPAGEYKALDPGRADGLDKRYIYRIDVDEPVPALKRVAVTVYHRDPDFPIPTPNHQLGQDGLAISVGTLITEPAR